MNTGFRLSVVIATLGGESLCNTIHSLMNGTCHPDEILICIPEVFSERVRYLENDIVRIVPTIVKGQVKQRSFGFREAAFEIVMQLDDDVLFENDSLEKLTGHLTTLGKGNVVGPIYYGIASKQCNHPMSTGISALPKNLFDMLICAAPWGVKKMGKVTPIGINYGVDDAYCVSGLMPVDWLPGACALSFREDLILEDYFPFEGKAYCEDIFLSFYRSRADLKSWISTRVRVMSDFTPPEYHIQSVRRVNAIRRYYLKLTNGPRWRLFLYEIFCVMRSWVYSLFKKK